MIRAAALARGLSKRNLSRVALFAASALGTYALLLGISEKTGLSFLAPHNAGISFADTQALCADTQSDEVLFVGCGGFF